MRHPEFPIVSFLSIPLLLCSLPSHARVCSSTSSTSDKCQTNSDQQAGSVSIMSMIAWLAVVSIIRGINALVWAGNVDVRLQVWCDISTLFSRLFGVG